jgi:hypothetical protein
LIQQVNRKERSAAESQPNQSIRLQEDAEGAAVFSLSLCDLCELLQKALGDVDFIAGMIEGD